MNKPLIALTILLAFFAYNVTLGFAPLTLYYTTHSRNYHVYAKRPAILIVMQMNRDFPDMRLFQYYYDEYRVFWTIDVIGRRQREDSWAEYTTLYPDNTPINLWFYLNERDRTHIMVNPASGAELPIDDKTWNMMFEEETDLRYMDHRVWRLEQLDMPEEGQTYYNSDDWVQLWGYGRDQ